MRSVPVVPRVPESRLTWGNVANHEGHVSLPLSLDRQNKHRKDASRVYLSRTSCGQPGCNMLQCSPRGARYGRRAKRLSAVLLVGAVKPSEGRREPTIFVLMSLHEASCAVSAPALSGALDRRGLGD